MHLSHRLQALNMSHMRQINVLCAIGLTLLAILQQHRQAQATYLTYSSQQMQSFQQQSATNTFGQQQQQQQQDQTVQQQQLLPNIIPFSFNQNVQENQRAFVMCTTASGEMPVSFSWLQDSQLLSPQLAQARRIQVKSDQDSSTLKISTVRLEHAGNYTCVAKNRFGSHLHTAQLVVLGEPRWSKEPLTEPIVATRGQTIVIDCKTTGYPRPQQAWQIKSKYEVEPRGARSEGNLLLGPLKEGCHGHFEEREKVLEGERNLREC